MRRLSKYQWLFVIGIGLFIFCWMVFGKDAEFKETNYPLEVIDNEIRIKETGEVLYRFIPVDGGKMDFDYSDTIIINDDTTVLINSSIKDIPSFFIGETPVTKRLWDYVMKERNEYNEIYNEMNVDFYFAQYKDDVCAYGWKEFILRLENLTGFDFCLPNNYQWEYAARGGKLSKNFKYSGSDNIEEVAYYKGNTPNDKSFRASKQKKANELGLYDMSGSVWELTTSPITQIFPTMSMIVKDDPDGHMGISRGGSFIDSEEECSVRHIGCLIYIVSGARLLLKTDSKFEEEIDFGSFKNIYGSEIKGGNIAIGWDLQHFVKK